MNEKPKCTPRQIVLLRHGESVWNKENRFTGWTDIDLSEHDYDCLKFALENGVTAISQSFVETAADIDAVRKVASDLGYQTFIIAKIERVQALTDIEEILKAADGIMISHFKLAV